MLWTRHRLHHSADVAHDNFPVQFTLCQTQLNPRFEAHCNVLVSQWRLSSVECFACMTAGAATSKTRSVSSMPFRTCLGVSFSSLRAGRVCTVSIECLTPIIQKPCSCLEARQSNHAPTVRRNIVPFGCMMQCDASGVPELAHISDLHRKPFSHLAFCLQAQIRWPRMRIHMQGNCKQANSMTLLLVVCRLLIHALEEEPR